MTDATTGEMITVAITVTATATGTDIVSR